MLCVGAGASAVVGSGERCLGTALNGQLREDGGGGDDEGAAGRVGREAGLSEQQEALASSPFRVVEQWAGTFGVSVSQLKIGRLVVGCIAGQGRRVC